MSVIVISMINCKALWQIHCDKCTNISFTVFHRSSYLPIVGKSVFSQITDARWPKCVGIGITHFVPWNKCSRLRMFFFFFLPYYTCSAAQHTQVKQCISGFHDFGFFVFDFDFPPSTMLSKFYDLGLWNPSTSRFDILENAWASVGKSTCLPEKSFFFFFKRPQLQAGQQGFVMFPWQSSTLSYNVWEIHHWPILHRDSRRVFEWYALSMEWKVVVDCELVTEK